MVGRLDRGERECRHAACVSVQQAALWGKRERLDVCMYRRARQGKTEAVMLLCFSAYVSLLGL